jgi:hypothetical protein
MDGVANLRINENGVELNVERSGTGSTRASRS